MIRLLRLAYLLPLRKIFLFIGTVYDQHTDIEGGITSDFEDKFGDLFGEDDASDKPTIVTDATLDDVNAAIDYIENSASAVKEALDDELAALKDKQLDLIKDALREEYEEPF